VAGKAQRQQVSEVIATAYADRNDMMNVQPCAVRFAVLAVATIALQHNAAHDTPIVIIQSSLCAFDAPDVRHVFKREYGAVYVSFYDETK
jgi:hypothetical protein